MYAIDDCSRMVVAVAEGYAKLLRPRDRIGDLTCGTCDFVKSAR